MHPCLWWPLMYSQSNEKLEQYWNSEFALKNWTQIGQSYHNFI